MRDAEIPIALVRDEYGHFEGIVTPADLLAAPPAGATYDPLPAWMDEPKELDQLVKDLVARVLAEETQGVWVNPTLKLHGLPGEPRAAFDARCAAAVSTTRRPRCRARRLGCARRWA